MRKSTLVAAAAAFSVGMFASGQVMAGKIVHVVSGGGMNTGFPVLNNSEADQSEWTYGFTALEKEDGTVKGQAQFSRLDDSTIKVHVAITCLNVDDYFPAAVITGIVVESNVIAVGTAVGFAVVDDGGLDWITPVKAAIDDDPQVCDTENPARMQDIRDQLLTDLQPWENGNVTIR